MSLDRRGALRAMLAAAGGYFARVSQQAPRGVEANAGASRVETFSLKSAVFDNTRTVRVYLPATYHAAAARYPVLYLNDGFAVFSPRRWNAPAILDRLSVEQVIRPIVVVGIDNAASITGVSDGAAARGREYLPYTDPSWPELGEVHGLRYPAFLFDDVIPEVERRFHVSREPAERAVGGSSLGGIAALVAVLRRPAAVGLLMLESTPLFLFDERLVDEAAKLSAWPHTVYLGLGTAETPDQAVLARGQRAFDRFAEVVARKAPHTRLLRKLEEGATHTSAAWSRRLPMALGHLFPPAR